MEEKWKIPPGGDDRVRWESAHHDEEYANVWSVTPDRDVRDTVLRFVDRHARRVLIPGCGSKTHLEQQLVAEHPYVQAVYCTDRSQSAIDQAHAHFQHPKVCYRTEDTEQLSFSDGEFDLVLVVNSILSPDDQRNRNMVKECQRVLRPGGRLVGLFPTIFCALEISYLDDNFEQLRESGAISVEDNAFYEQKQDVRQIFYTPLRLARIAKEAGFSRDRFEIQFFDSEFMQKETERYYGIPRNSDVFVWEILAVLQK